MRFRLRRTSGPADSARFRRATLERLGQAAARASDTAGRRAKEDIQTAMEVARLGRLKGAVSYTSNRRRGKVPSLTLERGRFRVGALVYARGSERSLGAFQAYSEGATIRSRRGGWLWIATDAIPRRAGRFRMTPARYRALGFEERIGPLVPIPGRSPGERLLIVKDVTVHRIRGNQARRLPKRGSIGATRERRDVIVAFVGIRMTARQRRFEPLDVVRAWGRRLPHLIRAELGPGSATASRPVGSSTRGGFRR